jgi:large subunit ribosomal protein L29
MTKARELRDQSDQQLTARVRDVEKELFQLRNELALMHKIEKPHLIQAKRKEIAQMLTILTERKKGIDREKVSIAVEEKKEKKAKKEKAEKKAEAKVEAAEEEKTEKKEKVRKKREKKE